MVPPVPGLPGRARRQGTAPWWYRNQTPVGLPPGPVSPIHQRQLCPLVLPHSPMSGSRKDPERRHSETRRPPSPPWSGQVSPLPSWNPDNIDGYSSCTRCSVATLEGPGTQDPKPWAFQVNEADAIGVPVSSAPLPVSNASRGCPRLESTGPRPPAAPAAQCASPFVPAAARAWAANGHRRPQEVPQSQSQRGPL